MLDEDTVAGLDKFENFFVNRLPIGCEEVAEDDPTSTKFNFENGYLNGAAFKMDKINHFFLGEVGTCIQKAKLSLSSSELIVYGTTMGSICALLPLETRQDVDFFIHLQMYLQVECQPLGGREHQTFRSAIEP
jgi:splicing factor 3B subunit 3